LPAAGGGLFALGVREELFRRRTSTGRRVAGSEESLDSSVAFLFTVDVCCEAVVLPLLLSSYRHQRFEEFRGTIPGRQPLDEGLLLLLRQHDTSKIRMNLQ
jgi:hypothetical protein